MAAPPVQIVATVGLLAALSFVAMLVVEVPVFVEWLKYDPGDIPALIGGFTLGPRAGMTVVVLRNLLRLLVKPDLIGLGMNTLAGCVYVGVAASYYQTRLTRKDAAVGLAIAGVAQVLVCIPAAAVALPLYGFPQAGVPGALVGLILPFNALKVTVNGVLTFLLYKQLASRLPRLRPPRPAGPPPVATPEP